MKRLNVELAEACGFSTPPTWWHPSTDLESANILLERIDDYKCGRDKTQQSDMNYFCTINYRNHEYTVECRESLPLAISLAYAEYAGIYPDEWE